MSLHILNPHDSCEYCSNVSNLQGRSPQYVCLRMSVDDAHLASTNLCTSKNKRGGFKLHGGTCSGIIALMLGSAGNHGKTPIDCSMPHCSTCSSETGLSVAAYH
eukprot:scaffold398958_cov19-Prasinocladus_malaysianus.AAC.2